MKKIILIIMAVILTGCASLPQHKGVIPLDVSPTYNQSAKQGDENLAEIICAEGERQYYFLGTSKPSLSLMFTDEGFKFFNDYKSSWKLAPGKRNFTLHWSFDDRYADFKVSQFEFKANEKYLAKYSVQNRQIKVWIETEDGTVVFGKRPNEGEF
ncbi:hypothetical protein GCM10008107_23130 [Psychrosphaera saromensis]|uniref:Lipoprotein n=1 Tax=Psychrosphaera saromensis TaxID=716813 RepID=A0A2S7UQT3_9GAMM|nr:hypothetical protein [Psychrosphaera saromensis]PQJ52354.1 hypothetical protein BTO11_00930 [Psychrosphaera saromensis]GHB73084.1 hypothetical protein GCM10008107_23130 [Psychrosphaera saromensis]GLQ13484.1 hypothetical protein GCM10007917_09390 [Psychrosphaera saromensis]